MVRYISGQYIHKAVIQQKFFQVVKLEVIKANFLLVSAKNVYHENMFDSYSFFCEVLFMCFFVY